MRRGTVIAVMVVVLFCTITVGSTGAELANVSGPEFLRGIGPTDPRVDNPVAAGVTAVAVAVVILRGLYKDRQED